MALEGLPGLNATDWYGWAGQTDMLARRPATNPLHELAPEKLRMARGEGVSVPVGTERTLADISGPGSVRSLWMALGGDTSGPTLDARLRVYYDGSSTPAIDVDFGTLLASHFAANGPWHATPHVHMEIVQPSTFTALLLTFPMPFGTSIRVAYYNLPSSGAAGGIYWMLTYRLYDTDRADGLRLRYQGARFADQRVTLTAAQTSTRLSTSGGPGAIVWHSYVGGLDATNLSWLERNIVIAVDGETTGNATIRATGTEDWYDSGWYFEGWPDFLAGVHSYVGADNGSAWPNIVGMATDLLSKWGGVPFESTATVLLDTEAACTTSHTFSDAILYYSLA